LKTRIIHVDRSGDSEIRKEQDMFKKLAFLACAFCLAYLTGFSSAVADNSISKLSSGEPAAKSGLLELPEEVNPLTDAIFKTCTAQRNCPAPFDSPIMCTGNSSCQVYPYQVTCDGKVVGCSCSIAPSGCIDPFGYCLCRSQGSAHAQCLGNCFSWSLD
jgi:hypothetical protein